MLPFHRVSSLLMPPEASKSNLNGLPSSVMAAYPSADLRGGIQAAGNVLRGGGQKGLQCAQVGKGGGNPAAERCICHIAAEGVGDAQIGVNPPETRAAVKQDSDAVVLKARFQGKCVQTQSLPAGQYGIAALPADIEVAARVAPVGDIPVAV